MNALLEQFLSEARESLQSIGEKLMQLEQSPNDVDLMNELFRPVHTLKGNSGLFDFPEMTRVLHASEDLMDMVRNGRISYSRQLADHLLNTMDFVSLLCEEIESKGGIEVSHSADSVRLSELLRGLIASNTVAGAIVNVEAAVPICGVSSPASLAPESSAVFPLTDIPEAVRMDAYRRAREGSSLHWLIYTPEEECFFQGQDPLFQARQTPDLLWGDIVTRQPWPDMAELDTYRCVLDYRMLTAASHKELTEYYRYVPDQVRIMQGNPLLIVIPEGDSSDGPVYEDFVCAALRHLESGDLVNLKLDVQTELELSTSELWFSSALRWLLVLLDCEPDNRDALRVLIESIRILRPPDMNAITLHSKDVDPADHSTSSMKLQPMHANGQQSKEDAAALGAILTAQRQILMLDDNPAWLPGRLKAVAGVLANCSTMLGDSIAHSKIGSALEQDLATGTGAALLAWLDASELARQASVSPLQSQDDAAVMEKVQSEREQMQTADFSPAPQQITVPTDDALKFGRRAEDQAGGKSLKVDQAKIEVLMNLIGEMVVSKNALPYLAQRAEKQYGVPEVAREIKAQYAVINRIVEEMQGAIMQVRMMPVSFVFQRFPRLVRDISRKLGKEVNLVMEGEETEADKNIIESLADPLIHIIRNSLDHGLETPDVRLAGGKSAAGTLTIRASQEADRVVIEIIDDGKGIDPDVIKRKAYEKGSIDEATLERISDRDALNLVFAAGFSTVETVSDLSGRGVGMDVVRTGVEKVNGDILLESEVGKGTRMRISLPLSMAVTNVMIVESDRQIFGVPMDIVVETVRIPLTAIHSIKNRKTVVLRGRIVPLKALNALLELSAEPKVNNDNELAVLVVRVGSDVVGLIVDRFCETVDVIQKPLTGVFSSLSAYSGSALMGDGSVLMVLNIKEIL